MGDHRATIKITFEMHGVTTTREMWINWWRGASDDLPSSVVDCFREAEMASMAKFDDNEFRTRKLRADENKKLIDSARAKLTPDEIKAIMAARDG